MLKKLILAACSLFMASQLMAAQPAASGGTHVLLTTSAGEIEIEVNDAQAPISARNFLEYVQAGFYNGTIFHRVIPGFMIQGGGFTPDLQQKDTERAITNEAYNGLLNDRGTVAMARTNDPNSATSQFFINLSRNDFLNPASGNAGYAVFGKVVRGMDVVDKIAGVSTGQQHGMGDVPMQPLLILSAKRL